MKGAVQLHQVCAWENGTPRLLEHRGRSCHARTAKAIGQHRAGVLLGCRPQYGCSGEGIRVLTSGARLVCHCRLNMSQTVNDC